MQLQQQAVRALLFCYFSSLCMFGNSLLLRNPGAKPHMWPWPGHPHHPCRTRNVPAQKGTGRHPLLLLPGRARQPNCTASSASSNMRRGSYCPVSAAAFIARGPADGSQGTRRWACAAERSGLGPAGHKKCCQDATHAQGYTGRLEKNEKRRRCRGRWHATTPPAQPLRTTPNALHGTAQPGRQARPCGLRCLPPPPPACTRAHTTPTYAHKLTKC